MSSQVTYAIKRSAQNTAFCKCGITATRL